MLHKLLSAILVMLLTVLPAAADTLTIPNSFTDGTTASATQVSANFTAISTVVNGNIANANIKSAAAISLSKLDLTTELFVLRAAANRCISAGTTGDTVPRVGLNSDGQIFFGPGGATATDLILKRTDANTLAIRNAADNADKNLTVGTMTASGAVAGTTGTFSGAVQAPSLSLTTTPLPYTSGGTGLATAAIGTVLVGNGTGYTALGPGTANQVIKSNGTTFELGSVGGSFGGDGSAGAVTKGAVTETTQLQLNATDFTQTVSTTWAPLSGTIVNATSTCAFNGTTNVGTGCAGGTAGAFHANVQAGQGAGPGGGCSGFPGYGESGPGGGNGGNGGQGGSMSASIYSFGGQSYPPSRLGGSGGGGGGYYTAVGGAGGNGGGSLIACSIGAMTVGASGTINADGGAGVAATGAGGGGGAGGTVSLNSQTSIANSGSILCRGGNGGNSVSAAGGATGGGGYIQFVSPSNTNGTRTVTAGATIGTGSPTITATTGSAGLAVSITATPNLPLIISMQSDNFARMKSIALAHRVLNFPAREGFDVELTQREAAQACSRGSVIQFAKLVDGNMEESTCIEIGDHVKGLDNAA